MRLLALLLLAAQGAWAEPVTPFSVELFQSLQNKERVILLHFTSSSCGVCPRQTEALEAIAGDPFELAPAILEVDSEKETRLQGRFKATPDATLIMLRGGLEIGRAAGLDNEEDIRAFIHTSQERLRGMPAPREKRATGPKR